MSLRIDSLRSRELLLWKTCARTVHLLLTACRAKFFFKMMFAQTRARQDRGGTFVNGFA